MKKHRLTSINTVYSLTCGSCHAEFEESGGDLLQSDDGSDIGEGSWIECPECEEELEVADPHSDEEEDEEEESDDEED